MQLFHKLVLIIFFHSSFICPETSSISAKKVAYYGAALIATSITTIAGVLVLKQCGFKGAKYFDKKYQLSDDLVWLKNYLLETLIKKH